MFAIPIDLFTPYLGGQIKRAEQDRLQQKHNLDMEKSALENDKLTMDNIFTAGNLENTMFLAEQSAQNKSLVNEAEQAALEMKLEHMRRVKAAYDALSDAEKNGAAGLQLKNDMDKLRSEAAKIKANIATARNTEVQQRAEANQVPGQVKLNDIHTQNATVTAMVKVELDALNAAKEAYNAAPSDITMAAVKQAQTAYEAAVGAARQSLGMK